jgi:hypothetical protein
MKLHLSPAPQGSSPDSSCRPQAGIQGREGKDTGFRRYDGSPIPIRCQIVPVLVFSKEDAKRTKFGMSLSDTFVFFVIFVVKTFRHFL